MKNLLILILSILITGCNNYNLDRKDREKTSFEALEIVQIIDPCGNAFSIEDEVILKLQNGTLLILNGDDRFIELEKGTWETSDGTECNFIVTEEGMVVW